MAAYLLSPLIMDAFGSWRALFYAYGIVGSSVSMVGVCKRFANRQLSPKKFRPMSYAASFEFQLVDKDDDRDPRTSPFVNSIRLFKNTPSQRMLRSKGAWAMLLAHSAKTGGGTI